jgi:replication initiator protein RepSA
LPPSTTNENRGSARGGGDGAAPNLPRRPVEHRFVGRTKRAATDPPASSLSPLDTYGAIESDGAALDPDSYDYRRAARDAIHLPKIVDRFWQNTRRCVGWDVQYSAPRRAVR